MALALPRAAMDVKQKSLTNPGPETLDTSIPAHCSSQPTRVMAAVNVSRKTSNPPGGFGISQTNSESELRHGGFQGRHGEGSRQNSCLTVAPASFTAYKSRCSPIVWDELF
jgi:hypothetical protein